MARKREKEKKTLTDKPKTGSWRDEGVVRVTVELAPTLVEEIRAAGNVKGLKLTHMIRLWLLERAKLERGAAAATAANGTGI